MNILVIGQCTLHWGRMEFGNIGNYYIVEPLFRELHKTFPGADIRTTLQMSERFCSEENITCLPLELYYAWRCDELELARKELLMAEAIIQQQKILDTTPYLDAVCWADLVIDFSGDIWGDNAELLGPDRFEVGLVKDLIAQKLGKPTAMLAGSPGPFSNESTIQLARQVYSGFTLVTNREPVSTQLLGEWGFDTRNTIDAACPSFLFEGGGQVEANELLRHEMQKLCDATQRPTIGFVLCGWNFERGPFDLWPRSDSEFENFVLAIESVVEETDANIFLMSHANGFDIPPAEFKLKHGRDYPIVKQLQGILSRRGLAENVTCCEGVYDAWQTKAIIGQFDMFISGRVHGAIAALSQCVPTVILDYGHDPKAHKLKGFAAVSGVSDYVADPQMPEQMVETILKCWHGRLEVSRRLSAQMPKTKTLVRENFRQLLERLR